MALLFVDGFDYWKAPKPDDKCIFNPKRHYGNMAITIECTDCHCQTAIRFEKGVVGKFATICCPLCQQQIMFTPTEVKEI